MNILIWSKKNNKIYTIYNHEGAKTLFEEYIQYIRKHEIEVTRDFLINQSKIFIDTIKVMRPIDEILFQLWAFVRIRSWMQSQGKGLQNSLEDEFACSTEKDDSSITK